MSNDTIKHGEVSWNDEVYSGGGDKKVNSKDLFLRLKDGHNEMRLVTQPFQYLVHKYKKEGDPGFGQKVNCSALHGSCPLCDLGDKAKRRWFLGVISRDTGTYKILDISFAVFGQIQKLATAARWGDPTKYDIDIVVNKNGGATGYYTVQPIPKEPLSAQDQAVKDNSMDLEDLKRRVSPPTADKVQERLDRINGLTTGKPGTKSAATKSVAPVSMATDEDDTEFPSYDTPATN